MDADVGWVYERLVCEFGHWDCCLLGLINDDGAKKLVEITGDPHEYHGYRVYDIAWDEECDEYLEDYRFAYHHWFRDSGRRPRYDGRELTWFVDKRKNRNPIEEKAIGRA